MPRVSRVLKEEAVSALEKYIEHFKNPLLPVHSATIWQTLSNELGSKWSAHVVYINVRENRRDILSTARSNQGVVIEDIAQDPSYISDTSFDPSRSVHVKADPDYEFSQNAEFTAIKDYFNLSLTIEFWNNIKPKIPVEYGKQSRQYDILAPNAWTDIVFDAFFKRYRFPCAYTFKRAKVYPSADSLHYIEIFGRCKSKSCSNPFFGYVEKEPVNGEDLHIKIKTRDTSLDKHEPVKRSLRGLKRKIVAQEAAIEGPSNWKKRKARENGQVGEMEPPNIYGRNVLSQAKKEYIDSELKVKPSDSRDLVRTIESIKVTPPYIGTVQGVASNPFFTMYMTVPQVHAYNEYRRLVKRSTVSVDATGSIVQKLQRPDSTKTGHIFLYVIVINFDKTTLSVGQLLSESHTTELVEYWLRTWMRHGARPPKQAVSDYGRSILCGMCLAFNNQTIKSYVNDRFLAVSQKRKDIQEPITYIRIDVAHIMKAVTKWQCFKSVNHPAVRGFFIRCISLMVDAESFEQFEELISLTFIVAVHTHEDSQLNSSFETPKNARKKLEHIIAVRGTGIEFDEDNSDGKKKLKDGDDNIQLPEEEEEQEEEVVPNSLTVWLNDVLDSAKKFEQLGSDVSAFYLPTYADRLIQFAKEFPLWSGVCVPNGNEHATSSYVEGYFSDLKTNVMKNNKYRVKLPLRVDKFLKIHLEDLIGAVKQFESKMTACKIKMQRDASVTEESNSVLDTVDETITNNCIAHYLVEGDTGACNQKLSCSVSNPMSLKHWKQKSSNAAIPCNDTNSNVHVPTESTKLWENSDLKAEENWRNKALKTEVIPLADSDSSYIAEIQAEVSGSSNTDVICQSDLKLIDSFINKNPTIHTINGSMTNEFNPAILTHFNDCEQQYVEDDLLKILTNEDINNNELPLSTSSPIVHTQVQNLDESLVDGKTIETKKSKTDAHKKKGFYFRAFPEIKVLNTLNHRLVGKNYLLVNGNRTGLAKVDNVMYMVYNTCTFDSIAQILLCSSLDDNHYSEWLKQSPNEVAKFILRLAETGPTAEIYQRRAQLLIPVSKTVKTTKIGDKISSISLDATNNVSRVWERLFEDEPSVFKTYKCSRPHCHTVIAPQQVLDVKHNILLNKDMNALEEALDYQSYIFNLRCTQRRCSGKRTETKTANCHIFIELDVICVKSSRIMRCKLKDFPTTIQLDGVGYRLAGAVHLSSDHYTAYCRRVDGHWQCWNGLKDAVVSCSEDDEIQPSAGIYIIKV